MAFALRSPVGAGAAEATGVLGPAASRQLHRCPGGARHAPSPQRLCVMTRASGQPRKGVQAASATSTPQQAQRSSSSSTEPPPGPPPGGPQSLPASGVTNGRPLLNGGNVVEEDALASALATVQLHASGQLGSRRLRFDCGNVLDSSYARCGEVTEDYGRTFYMATQLMTEKRRKAIWAIYVWCRRTDELVDGPNSAYITPAALDRWTERLEAVFEGRPFDLLDAALTDTVASFPVDKQPFLDMIDGMRMDLIKTRYATFDELYEYCYRVAGTVALMSVPIMGICPQYRGPVEPVYRAALALGLANQLTNILRDVGEDARTRGRIYLPVEDLIRFGITEAEVLNGSLAPVPGGPVDPRWVALMQFQITRAQQYFADAEAGVAGLDKSARWPVWAALILYRRILDAIQANGYDNFNLRAYVPSHTKLLLLPVAYLKAQAQVSMEMATPKRQ